MDYIDVENRIKSLTDKLNNCNLKYFTSGDSLLTDYEYDCLLDELLKLEEEYPQYKLNNSPTNVLGDVNISGFSKIEHRVPMLSLKKTYSFEDLNSFLDNIESNFKVTYVCELKLDGISIDAHYVNGALKSLSTRGDGNIGDDVTFNKSYIKNLPQSINCKYDVHLRGEVLMRFEDFYNANRIIKDKKFGDLLSNPRNAVSGTLKSLNKSEVLDRNLTVFFYNIVTDDPNVKIETQVDVLKNINMFNAPICKLYKFCGTRSDIFDYINHFEKAKKDLEFPIDGVVIKVNELKYFNLLGNTSKNPKGAIAFKYKPESVSTKLINIEFTVGRTGIITPVANFEPININGTVIRKATLHNEGEINKFGLREGDNVLVKKSGEIIPKIIGVDINKRDLDGKKIEFITKCPACNNEIIKKNDLFYCQNENCKGRIIELLKHFVSKNALDIKTIGPKLVKLLVDRGLLNKISDIYILKYRDLVRLPGVSAISAQKIITEVNKSKEKPFYRVLYGLGIDGVGEVIAKNIADRYLNIDSFKNCRFDDLVNIKLVGEEIAKNIVNYLQNPNNIQLLNDLKNFGLNVF